MSWIYYTEKAAAELVISLFTSLTVTGRENVPGKGALLVVANHMSVADPAILGVKLGRRVVFMAKEELFRSWLPAYFVRGFGSFPVYKSRRDLKAIRLANRVLACGGALAMFPEGRRSKSGHMERAYNGSALIALHNDVPILPVGITGTEVIRGTGWMLHRPRVTMTIGEPFRLPKSGSRVTREEVAGYTDMIMKRIAGLLPQRYRGRYGG